MIGSLVRWLGRGSSGRGSGSAPPFTPQLEVLEGRALPGEVSGGAVLFQGQAALLGAKAGSPSHVTAFGGVPGGVIGNVEAQAAVLGAKHGISTGSSVLSGGTEVTPFGSRLGTTGTGDGSQSGLKALVTRSTGEEIPQTINLVASKAGGAGDGSPFHLVGFISRSSGEEIPQQ
jgi:hypothetical protein